ncbi:hydrogenase assembly protein HypC [Aeromonas schubertii]|uniref:Hydrogenase assembly protein HypC n=1 Tax=Aeromonas schubertii TaxID=652 RepID=A0A0S2SDG7_9GAMM|nr:hydrogenase assembly protein HypC [Aeromonas schubertii]
MVQLHPEDNCVTVDTLGVQRRVSCMLLEEPLQVGDYVLLHIGFVMSKIDQEEAQASLESFRQMVALMPKQDTLPC